MAEKGVVIILFKDGTTDTLDVVYKEDISEVNEELVIKHTNRHTYKYKLKDIHKWDLWGMAE